MGRGPGTSDLKVWEPTEREIQESGSEPFEFPQKESRTNASATLVEPDSVEAF